MPQKSLSSLQFVSLSTTLSVLLLSASLSANADGLSDLKTALERLNGNSPIKASYQVEFLDVSDADDEEDRRETSGEVGVRVIDNDDGLQIIYSQEVMQLVETEAMQRTHDEEADTPTLNAIRDISARGLRNTLSASASLQRRLAKAEFVSEKAQEFEGKPARLLTFNLPLDAIINDKRTREYVKKFEGSYTILIDENGVPIEAKEEFNGKGRAFIVLSVSAASSAYNRYQVVGDRLLRIRNTYSSEFSSSFGDNMEAGSSLLMLEQTSDSLASNH